MDNVPKWFRHEIQLCNKTGWCPQGKETSSEKLRYFFGIEERIFGGYRNFL